jgi:peptidyl-tRNA hydrolase
LVRTDLSAGQQLVQACHAVAEAARHFIPPTMEHPHFVVCGVKNEAALQKAHKKIQEQGIRCRAFLEADIGDQMTALATEPIYDAQRRVFRNFQLLKPNYAYLQEMEAV